MTHAPRWDLTAHELVAGQHYPRDWDQFEAWFATETACREYVAEMRWSDGFVCPTCTSTTGRRHERGWWCPTCRKWASLTAGTAFGGTHVPLRTWLEAIWLTTNEKDGMSARGLERATGVNYRTAWSMLHKVRANFAQHNREPLSGLVEINQTFVCDQAIGSNPRERSHQRKAIVVIACECLRCAKTGSIRIGRLADATATAIEPWVTANVEKGSSIHTVGRSGCARLKTLGYRHMATAMSTSPDSEHVVFPRVETVASLLRHWLLGTYQGSVRGDHIDTYLDEFVFRFNRRNVRNRGLLFHQVLDGCLKPGSYVPRSGRSAVRREKPATSLSAATPVLQRQLMQTYDDQLFDWFGNGEDKDRPDPFGPLETSTTAPRR